MFNLISSTEVIPMQEVKSPNPVKAKDVISRWDQFLGGGTYTDIHPVKGIHDCDRIVSEDGTRSVRFTESEMKSMGKKSFHYHEEEWVYDPIMDTMKVYNKLRRIQYQPRKK